MEWGSGGAEWAVGGGLNPLLGLFGLAMSLRSASYRIVEKFGKLKSICVENFIKK